MKDKIRLLNLYTSVVDEFGVGLVLNGESTYTHRVMDKYRYELVMNYDFCFPQGDLDADYKHKDKALDMFLHYIYRDVQALAVKALWDAESGDKAGTIKALEAILDYTKA